MDSIDGYLEQFTGDQHSALRHIHEVLSSVAEAGEWCISWNMPTLKVGGYSVISFGGFSDHNSIFPGPEVITALSEELSEFQLAKGAVKLPADYKLSKQLIKKAFQSSIDALNASFPRSGGLYKQFYSNGQLKNSGRYLEGLMHGHWKFFRKDGSIMREGSFNRGVQLDDWKTHIRPS